MSATPGPWQVCDGREHGVETLDGEWICDCIETPDNARLIAAAPELLEMLKELVEHASNLRRNAKLYERAEALIRKIEG